MGHKTAATSELLTLSVQPNEHQGVDELVYFIVNEYKNYPIKFPKQKQKNLIDNLFYDLYFKC